MSHYFSKGHAEFDTLFPPYIILLIIPVDITKLTVIDTLDIMANV